MGRMLIFFITFFGNPYGINKNMVLEESPLGSATAMPTEADPGFPRVLGGNCNGHNFVCFSFHSVIVN